MALWGFVGDLEEFLKSSISVSQSRLLFRYVRETPRLRHARATPCAGLRKLRSERWRSQTENEKKEEREKKKAATKTPSLVQTGLTVKLRVEVGDKGPFFPERNILISLTYTDLTDWASVNCDVR